MAQYVHSLDQGTTNSRARLFDHDGKIAGLAQHEFKQYYPDTGWVEHDPMDILTSQLSSAVEVLAKARVRPRHVVALGVANQRETTIVWDRETGRASKGAPLPFLGLACAVGVSSIYFNQPLLSEMAKTFHSRPEHIGFVAVATRVGYAAGLLTFVPMGDVMERRSLMMRMYAAVSVALLLVAVPPSLLWVIFASVLVGLFASVTQIVLPLAPDLVDDSMRGRAIGVVMTGLLVGVLLARTFSGWVSKIHGWRWVFVAAAIINAIFVPLLWRKMPRLAPRENLRYADAMISLWTLFRTAPLLREASIVGALIFASFSCFWTTLAFLLEKHYQLGPGAAGSFGIVGAAGAMVASVAGRLADRHGARRVASAGLATLTFSYLFLWAAVTMPMSTVTHVAVLVFGVVILDIGVQMTQIANQTRIFGLVPSARSRINTVYMVLYFGGAAVGSWLSTLAWAHWGWNGVCVLALGFMALAALRHITGIRTTASEQPRDPEAEKSFLKSVISRLAHVAAPARSRQKRPSSSRLCQRASRPSQRSAERRTQDHLVIRAGCFRDSVLI